ncbi:hypothetical protein EDB83DRAFT_2312581 [Lactarius deliciosus]|nr:hypothetical protein EDB83DRAFT_2312581 [Lactarius deliciosus]
MIIDTHDHVTETSHLSSKVTRLQLTSRMIARDSSRAGKRHLHTPETINIGIPPTRPFCEYSLEENYGFMLFHEAVSQYFVNSLNELQAIFLRTRTDAFTPETPTSPYTVEECEEFVYLPSFESSKGYRRLSYQERFKNLWMDRLIDTVGSSTFLSRLKI